MNYWSDYLTKYPNAKEIEKSGLPNLLWDTPYNYGGSLGNFTDNHPLINPITITASPTSTTTPTTSRTPSTTPIITPTSPPTHQPTPSIEPTATVPEFPAWVVLPLAMITILLTIIIIRRKADKTTLMSFPTARCTPFFISR
jgi:hypothetical protein